MGGPILHMLKLVLKISSKSISDNFYKGLGIVSIFMEKSLKFFLGDNNIRPFFLSMLVFILCLATADAVSKKIGRKQDAIVFVSSSHIEMIFILLAKPVVIQM